MSYGGASEPTAAETDNSSSAKPRKNEHIGVATHFVRKHNMLHWDPQKFVPMIADLDVGWVRDEIMWNKIEREPGKFVMPEGYMEWIDLAHEAGLNIVVILSGDNKMHGREDTYQPDKFAAAAVFLATELKGKIQAIEVLNEPFNWYARAYEEGTSRGGDLYGRDENGAVESWLGRYVNLLNVTAKAVKAVNPDMKVVGLGAFPAMNMRMIELGIAPEVDGVVLHPYSYRITPEVVPYAASEENFIRNGGRQTADEYGSFASLIEYARDFSAQHDGPEEIWLTEWGYTTKRPSAGSRSSYNGFTEQAQAAYIQRRFMEGLGLGVDVSTVYALVNEQFSAPEKTEFSSEDNFGLVHADGTPKPAYYAVQRLARATAGLTVSDDVAVHIVNKTSRTDDQEFHTRDGMVLKALDRIACYQFKDYDGRTVLAIWSTERLGDRSPRPADIFLDVPVDAKIEVTDLMTGDEYVAREGEAEGKRYLKNFRVPPHPVLLKIYE